MELDGEGGPGATGVPSCEETMRTLYRLSVIFHFCPIWFSVSVSVLVWELRIQFGDLGVRLDKHFVDRLVVWLARRHFRRSQKGYCRLQMAGTVL